MGIVKALKPAVAAAAIMFGLGATPALAAKVGMGWDIWETKPGTVYPSGGTYFLGIPFMGVPLLSYDFGVNAYGDFIGVQPLSPRADTIVQRLEEAVVADPVPPTKTADPIPIHMVAWQLQTVGQFDLGAGLDWYFLTLQSLRGGPGSFGEMTITFTSDGGGTFTSYIDVAWDLRIGALNGPIIMSDIWRLESDQTPWGRIPPASPVAHIPGANVFLNGNNREWDFWPGVLPDGICVSGCWFIEKHPAGSASQHMTRVGGVPEPGTWAMLIAGFGLVGTALRRKATRQAAA